jgi:hypothetical protein
MKTGMTVLGATVILLSLILLGGCATGKYVPKPNEEIYGTWINEKMSAQKYVVTPDGWKQYLKITDTHPYSEGAWAIASKWTDKEGNIWYKSFGAIAAGPYAGFKHSWLHKFSKSATVWESVWSSPTNEQEAATPTYPTKIDPNSSEYNIYYRAEE